MKFFSMAVGALILGTFSFPSWADFDGTDRDMFHSDRNRLEKSICDLAKESDVEKLRLLLGGHKSTQRVDFSFEKSEHPISRTYMSDN